MDEKSLYYIWLSTIFNPGSSAPKFLLSHFNSIEELYNASNEDYEACGIEKSDLKRLTNKDLTRAKAILRFCTLNNVGLLCFDDPSYPERLKIIDNPPPLLYYKGRLCNLDDYPCLAMVGTRSCSEKGFRLAYETAYDAASKGAVIVNGLALGIDGACIAACLDANGYAVGLLGCGIDVIYPAANKELFKRLEASGLILTEFAPFSRPEGRNFPIRNRVISALSVATCIFEADVNKSGAMITAEHAISQGRSIFAVPAKPYDKNYSGALELIKNGASLLTEADDVLSEYSLNFPHRINLANKNEVPKDKLNRLVAQYFKKDIDPDQPVNRRFVYNKPAKEANNNAGKNDVSKVTNNKITDISEQNRSRIQPFCSISDIPITEQKPDDANEILNSAMLSETDRKIYEIILKNGPLTPDEIASHGFKIEQILSSLTILEIYTNLSALPGGRYGMEHK